jgi:hypothetical protein
MQIMMSDSDSELDSDLWIRSAPASVPPKSSTPDPNSVIELGNVIRSTCEFLRAKEESKSQEEKALDDFLAFLKSRMRNIPIESRQDLEYRILQVVFAYPNYPAVPAPPSFATFDPTYTQMLPNYPYQQPMCPVQHDQSQPQQQIMYRQPEPQQDQNHADQQQFLTIAHNVSLNPPDMENNNEKSTSASPDQHLDADESDLE